MPYIKKEDRPILQSKAKDLASHLLSVGDFNYAVSVILHEMTKRDGRDYLSGTRGYWPRSKRYTNMNALVGAMECCKLEFVRTVLSPYEDKKKAENGPVSELDARTLEDVR